MKDKHDVVLDVVLVFNGGPLGAGEQNARLYLNLSPIQVDSVVGECSATNAANRFARITFHEE